MQTQELFNASICHTFDLGIDRSNSIIRGAKVIEVGQINDDRPFQVDDTTLDQVIELGNRPNKGIKARFTHPQADGLGKHLGRWVNFRRDGDAVRADLQLAKSSFNTPSGDLGSYILDLASEDPDAFGVSISAQLDRETFASKEVIKPIRVEKLLATDVVDEPAATRGGLFSRYANKGEIQMADESKAEANEQPQGVVEQPSEVTLEASASNKQSFDFEKVREDAKPYIEAFSHRGAAWYLEGKGLVECYKIVSSELAEELECYKQENVALREQLEAALKSSGEDEPLSLAVEFSDEEKKRAEREARIEAAKKKGIAPSVARFAELFNKV